MLDISDRAFADLIASVMDELPREHMQSVQNVAIVYADEPTDAQRQKLALRGGQTLLGLYEGVPLVNRGGQTQFPPDKITIFKNSALAGATNMTQLRTNVKNTLWHEIAHFFGLDHDDIYRLEQKSHSELRNE